MTNYMERTIDINGIKDGEEYNTHIWKTDNEWCWEICDYKGTVIKTGTGKAFGVAMEDAHIFLNHLTV